jgi:uncharacterized protein
MLSVATTVLFAALSSGAAHHAPAYAFLQSLTQRRDVVISELVLLELYVLLRNAVVNPQPLGAFEASRVCDAFRQNPYWQVVGLPPETRPFHDKLWLKLAQADTPRRRAFDLRLALSLLDAGADEFATVNLKDFADSGFKRVWNPLASSQTP